MKCKYQHYQSDSILRINATKAKSESSIKELIDSDMILSAKNIPLVLIDERIFAFTHGSLLQSVCHICS